MEKTTNERLGKEAPGTEAVRECCARAHVSGCGGGAVRDDKALWDVSWGAVVADEAHRLKNPASSTAGAVSRSL